jgi:dihydrofolate reductase
LTLRALSMAMLLAPVGTPALGASVAKALAGASEIHRPASASCWQIVRRADSHEAVARLREQDGDALIFGSQTLWTDLLAHGLVDELHLMIGPKIVAGDHRAFDGVAETDLRLMGVRTRGGSDNVVLSYGLGGSPR